jgi:hypothetical protein
MEQLKVSRTWLILQEMLQLILLMIMLNVRIKVYAIEIPDNVSAYQDMMGMLVSALLVQVKHSQRSQTSQWRWVQSF